MGSVQNETSVLRAEGGALLGRWTARALRCSTVRGNGALLGTLVVIRKKRDGMKT